MKCEGDPVEKGESIFVVEADKVTTEVEAPASGVLAKIFGPSGGGSSEFSHCGGNNAQPQERRLNMNGLWKRRLKGGLPHHPELFPELFPAQVSSGQVAAMPAARHLARKLLLGVDLFAGDGNGTGRVIQVRDVEAASNGQAQAGRRAQGIHIGPQAGGV